LINKENYSGGFLQRPVALEKFASKLGTQETCDSWRSARVGQRETGFPIPDFLVPLVVTAE
jgi:hypothetical protein